MHRLLREPLVHFLLAGAVLVAASSFVSNDAIPRDDQIVVSTGQIEHLAARFARTWQRAPSPRELAGLIEDHVREEAAYREGTALGLAGDDAIIRRRVRQKLEFIAMDIIDLVDPGDEVLATYLAAHADDFREEPRFSFVQVYLDPARQGDGLAAAADRLLAALIRDPDQDVTQLGDPTLLDPVQDDLSPGKMAQVFGPEFASAVIDRMAQPADSETEPGDPNGPGSWFGPLWSSYGLHLVRILARTEARLPELAEIHDVVLREWENAQRVDLKEQFYANLLDQYEVSIEWPQAATRDSSR